MSQYFSIIQYKVSGSLQNKLFALAEFSLMLDLSSLTAVGINEGLVLLKWRSYCVSPEDTEKSQLMETIENAIVVLTTTIPDYM